MRILPCLCLLLVSGCVSLHDQLKDSSRSDTPVRWHQVIGSSLADVRSHVVLPDPPRKAAWELLQAAGEQADYNIVIDITAPNPRVVHPDELLPETPLSTLWMSEAWRSLATLRLLQRTEAEEHTWWRQVMAGICLEAGLSFTSVGTTFYVRRASGLTLSAFVRAGLDEGRYDADWRDATLAEAIADLKALFPNWAFELDSGLEDQPKRNIGSMRGSLARCAVDVAEWQLAYLFAHWAGLSCTETADGILFAGTAAGWQRRSGIWVGARIQIDGRTGEVLRRPK